MTNPKTLSIYIFKLYCKYFLSISLLLIGVLILSNIFDIFHKFKSTNVPSYFLWKLVIYKIPYLLNEVAALISFMTMLFLLKRLVKYNELVIILSSGIPLWRILIIPLFTALLLGIGMLFILHPLGTYGLQKYEYLESRLKKKKHSEVVVIKSGLLLFEQCEDHNQIIQAKSINLATKELYDAVLLFIDKNNSFLRRIDSKKATLDQGKFTLTDAKIITNNNRGEHVSLVIPTTLSIDNFKESLTPPELIIIWDLGTVINKLVKSGLPVSHYQIYYYKQLFKPLLMVATTGLAGIFLSLRQRDNSQGKVIIFGLLTGFIVYSILEAGSRILSYNGVTPLLAVMLPILLIMLISNFIVLHLHEA